MPTPQQGETQDEFMSKCVPMVLDDGTANSNDQAVAVCSSMWEDAHQPMQPRAYSWFKIRAVNEAKRIIEGIATTPELARDGDIIETQGIQFKLPLPFLFQHNAQLPLGNVIDADVTSEGIYVRIQVGSAGVADYIDEKWRIIKAGIVRGLSIGWRTLEEKFDKTIGGFRIIRSEWLELSAVPVPADPNATITSVRSADEAILAALGTLNRSTPARPPSQSPGVSGKPREKLKMTITEQIKLWETKRTTAQARMDELMAKSADAGQTLDPAQSEEYDTLETEVRNIDGHITRLKAHEARLVSTATAVTTETAGTAQRAAETRGGNVVTVRPNVPPGTAFVRYAGALAHCRGNKWEAAQFAKRWNDSTPEVELVLRTAIDAGDTTTSGWASQLVPAAVQMQNEFLELLRPATIIGRIPGLNRVPFNVAVPMQTGDGVYQWVGEGAPKPVGKLTLSSATLRWSKAAGIIVITKELAMFSSPSAEGVIRRSMIAGCTRFLDQQFVSANAEVTNVSPAGILNGKSAAVSASGATATAFRIDFNTALQAFVTNNEDPTGVVVLMSAKNALGLSLLVNALGQPEFPQINASGGTIVGLPVVVSQNLGTTIILIKASDILLAEDGGVQVDVSDTASVEMNDFPTQGEESPITGAILKSFWQNNLIGLRVEQFITWKRARTSAVEWISGAAYGPAA